MILRRLRGFVAAFILLATLPVGVLAQAEPEVAAQAVEHAQTAQGQLDYIQWDRVALRAERLAEARIASNFAYKRLRVELVVWRDTFTVEMAQNSARLVTVTTQIAAIGPAQEGGGEDRQIVSRRTALVALRDRLAVPGILAREAHARANGLIAEMDTLVRARQTSELLVRGPSPLNPTYWSEALSVFVGGVRAVSIETVAGTRADAISGKLWQNLPWSVFYIIIAMVLLARGRRWVLRLERAISQGDSHGRPVWLFLLSLGQIVLPVIGLIVLVNALEVLDVFGLRGEVIIATIFVAGIIVVFGRWLAGHLFPVGADTGPLDYDNATRKKARTTSMWLTWAMALGLLLSALWDSGDGSDAARAVAHLPLQVLAGYLLFSLGSLIRRPPQDVDDAVVSQGRVRRILGQLCCLIGIAAPVLSALGFSAAAAAMFLPAVLTLAILGVVILLQRLVFSVYGLWGTVPDKGTRALMPVLIGFGLLLLALPVVALVWGARVSDLSELWTRFVDGFSIGDAHISPSNFITFALVFVVGYLATRFVQTALRVSVLPRTRLDRGGQNAIVAGFGYVGIMLAAIFAITMAGIDLSNLAIVAGALSVGIGFGLQNIVSNFVAGIILLIERPISEGDWIEVGGQMGYVRAISVRSTRIETFDRTDVIVPNADLVSGQVTNWTRGNLVGRIILPIGVAYGSDTARISDILQKIVLAHPMVLLSPPPSVLFRGFGESALDFEIRAILRDINFLLDVTSELNHAIAQKFTEEGIEIPFAQRDLWLRNPEVLHGMSKKETDT